MYYYSLQIKMGFKTKKKSKAVNTEAEKHPVIFGSRYQATAGEYIAN
jgi:hypothetical protein